MPGEHGVRRVDRAGEPVHRGPRYLRLRRHEVQRLRAGLYQHDERATPKSVQRHHLPVGSGGIFAGADRLGQDRLPRQHAVHRPPHEEAPGHPPHPRRRVLTRHVRVGRTEARRQVQSRPREPRLLRDLRPGVGVASEQRRTHARRGLFDPPLRGTHRVHDRSVRRQEPRRPLRPRLRPPRRGLHRPHRHRHLPTDERRGAAQRPERRRSHHHDASERRRQRHDERSLQGGRRRRERRGGVEADRREQVPRPAVGSRVGPPGVVDALRAVHQDEPRQAPREARQAELPPPTDLLRRHGRPRSPPRRLPDAAALPRVHPRISRLHAQRPAQVRRPRPRGPDDAAPPRRRTHRSQEVQTRLPPGRLQDLHAGRDLVRTPVSVLLRVFPRTDERTSELGRKQQPTHVSYSFSASDVRRRIFGMND
mmetsp:Transcript_7080/g.23239  ORF Transcript_7080/g.23239 Transcript_7080/m.23239 type:complete len:422 (+) Transcript_7080:1454-2719(+)